MPDDAIEEAFRKITVPQSPNMLVNNKTFHKYLTEGVDVEYRDRENSSRFGKVWAIDFENPSNNEFLAVNQFTIIENNNNRRPDIIVFINGLPIVVATFITLCSGAMDKPVQYNKKYSCKKV